MKERGGTHPVFLKPVTDADGLTDRQEVTGSANKKFSRKKTDPLHWDTDRGRVSDGAEVRAGSDPTNPTSAARGDQPADRLTVTAGA